MSGLHLPAFSAWLEYQLRGWDDWAAARDNGWLALGSGNERFPSIGHFMRHAFTPLHRYSDQIAGAEPLEDEAVGVDNWPALSSHAWACLRRHRQVVESIGESDFGLVLEFRTRSAGVLRVNNAIALTHAATHCAWHLGGVAHLLRSKGIEPPQRSDLIFALPAE